MGYILPGNSFLYCLIRKHLINYNFFLLSGEIRRARSNEINQLLEAYIVSRGKLWIQSLGKSHALSCWQTGCLGNNWDSCEDITYLTLPSLKVSMRDSQYGLDHTRQSIPSIRGTGSWERFNIWCTTCMAWIGYWNLSCQYWPFISYQFRFQPTFFIMCQLCKRLIMLSTTFNCYPAGKCWQNKPCYPLNSNLSNG